MSYESKPVIVIEDCLCFYDTGTLLRASTLGLVFNSQNNPRAEDALSLSTIDIWGLTIICCRAALSPIGH